MDLESYLKKAIGAVELWEARWGTYPEHPSLEVDEEAFARAFDTYLARLEGNYPFFHPRYAGQMLKPPHPIAIAGYLAAMLINPNNHALDGGPPTSAMEKEVIAALLRMFGFPDDGLGHLTGSGTIANLEAVWIAREMHSGKGVAFSDQAHYTHSRLSDLLRVERTIVPSDSKGRMRLDALEDALQRGTIGTVILTAGTTGVGAVDPVADVLPMARRYGARIHVDAAYGGFFVVLAGNPASPLREETRRHLAAISECDSVVVDPHKHGLQPYGCGCILFRDSRVGKVYQHDSPYTYFTSDELHLGEISFECSRGGAAAGALWLTLQMLPPAADEGLGPVLAAGLRAARDLFGRLDVSGRFAPLLEPELDILTYFPTPDTPSTSAIDAASTTFFEAAMNRKHNPLFLSVMRADAAVVAERYPQIERDSDFARVLRSVLMKPEHELYVDQLLAALSEGERVGEARSAE